MKTLTDKFALVVTAWVVLAGSYASFVNPERRLQCLLGIAVLGVAWTIRQLFRGDAESGAGLSEARRNITQSIVYAGLLLSVGLAEALGWVTASGDFRTRACQVLAGVMVMVIGNAIPKKAVTSKRFAATLRANGRALFLGGLGYALAWLLLPSDYANKVALSLMLLAFAYSISRVVYCAMRRNQSIPPAGSV